MRSYVSQDVFFDRMKKKPALQKILDYLDEYTIEELENIDGQPKWIRDHLVKLKTPSSSMLAEIMINAMNVEITYSDNPENLVFKWNGGERQFPCGSMGNMQIYLNDNDLLWAQEYTNDKLVLRLSSSTIVLRGNLRSDFLYDSEIIGKMIKIDYNKLVYRHLETKYSDISIIAKDENMSTLSGANYQITRH